MKISDKVVRCNMEKDILCPQTEVRLVKQDKNHSGFWQDFGDENWKRCSIVNNANEMSFFISVSYILEDECKRL